MSRRSYIVNGIPGGKPQFLVEAGFDRPLKYYFLQIMILPIFQEGDEIHYLFTNLASKYALGAMHLTDVQNELVERGIPWPKDFIDALHTDAVEHRVNACKSYPDVFMPLNICEDLKLAAALDEAEQRTEDPVQETDLF